MSRTAFISLYVVEPGLNILVLLPHPKLSLPSLPAGVGRARGRRGAAGVRDVCGTEGDVLLAALFFSYID